MSQKGSAHLQPRSVSGHAQLVGGISYNPRGHVLGIVGLGNISKLLAQKARGALGMKIHYFDVVRSPPETEQALSAIFHNKLEDPLALAYCTIKAMKPGARLINTARGQAVNENALVAALKSGHLSAAGLDVHCHEPQVSKELAAMDNVILTTHNGGGAITTRINFEQNAMNNIMEVVGD